MEALSIQPTVQTPKISLNPLIGKMEIKGRSIPDSPDEFWLPVFELVRIIFNSTCSENNF